MNDLLKNCCQAVAEKQYYFYCTLNNIAAYLLRVDWGMVLSTILMLVGIYADWKRKRKRKIEDEERKEKEINERLTEIRKNNERELQLKIDESRMLGETVEKLLDRIDKKDRYIDKLLNIIQNKQGASKNAARTNSGSRRAAQSKDK